MEFVGEALKQLRATVGPEGAAVLGFVGSPWTLATYVVEGKSTNIYKVIKSLMFQKPEVLDAILTSLAGNIAKYACYQIESGANYIQVCSHCGFLLQRCGVSTGLTSSVSSSRKATQASLTVCSYNSDAASPPAQPARKCPRNEQPRLASRGVLGAGV